MSERFAAEIDADGNVIRVVVLPRSAISAPAYCAQLGLAGEWRDASHNIPVGQPWVAAAHTNPTRLEIPGGFEIEHMPLSTDPEGPVAVIRRKPVRARQSRGGGA